MTDLTQNAPRSGHGGPVSEIEWPMGANSQLFAGAALMMTPGTGLAQNVTPTAAGVFLGFAKEGKDNRTGSPYGGLASSVTLKVEQKGRLWLMVATTTFALQDVGATIYASDGNTFTTAVGTNNIPIGKLGYVPAAAVGTALGEVLVDYEATSLRSL